MNVSFGNFRLMNNQIIDKSLIKLPLNISFPDTNGLHTLIIYDMVNSNIHFLEINIPGNRIDQGKILIPYIPLSLFLDDHIYIVDLFHQPYEMDSFDPNLNLEERFVFTIDPPGSGSNSDERYC
jgi:hypothetical protein